MDLPLSYLLVLGIDESNDQPVLSGEWVEWCLCLCELEKVGEGDR